MDPEVELTKDLVQIVNVFTAKMNGMRKYKKSKKAKKLKYIICYQEISTFESAGNNYSQIPIKK